MTVSSCSSKLLTIAMCFKDCSKCSSKRSLNNGEKLSQNQSRKQTFDLMSSSNQCFKNASIHVSTFKPCPKQNRILESISGYVAKNGKKEVMDQLELFGGFPMYEGDSWDSTKLNKSKLFEEYPELMSEFFDIQFHVRPMTEAPKVLFIMVRPRSSDIC